MTTTSSGISTPVIVSSGEDDHDDVPIYLQIRRTVRCGDPGFYWYVLKTRTDRHRDFSSYSCNEVSPLFKEEPFSRVYSGSAYLGGTLYLIGGHEYEPRPKSFFPVCSLGLGPPSRDVFYIDTTSTPGGGWKKLDHSLNVPRTKPYAFTIDSKIYVMGGGAETSPNPEVLDTSCMDDGWRLLKDSTDVPACIVGHAVIDGGKRILVHSRFDPPLYCYDVEADSWQVYLEHVVGLPRTRRPSFESFLNWESAFVDGILYYVDNDRRGCMFGIDVSRPRDTAEPKMVRLPSGRKLEDWPWDWIPQPPPPDSDLVPRRVRLVPLGSGKLGVLWTHFSDKGALCVCCSTIKMSKEEKKHEEGGGDNFELVALPLSLSRVLIHGSNLEDCLAVYPCQKTGPKGDINKDDNKISASKDVDDITLSANHRSSTGGSKKNRKKKGKN